MIVRAEQGDLQPIRIMTGELAQWFPQHAQMMDASLALHLRRVGFDPVTGVVHAPDALPGEMSEAARALPICYMHGIYDDVVNLSMGWDAKNRLEAAGLSPEWHEYPMRHEICRPQLDEIRRWLLARLGA